MSRESRMLPSPTFLFALTPSGQTANFGNQAPAPAGVDAAPPLDSPASARPFGLFAEVKRAQSVKASVIVLWRYLSLNVFAENIEAFDEREGDIASLSAIYNLIALISALLLSVGMAPFLSMASVVSDYGDTPLTRFTNVCIICVMGVNLLNLIVIVLLTFYITAVDRAQRHVEIHAFPCFGLPLVFIILCVTFSILWVLGNVFLTLSLGYGYFTIALVGMCACVCVPLFVYAFFIRLAHLRHKRGKRAELLRDISVREFEAIMGHYAFQANRIAVSVND